LQPVDAAIAGAAAGASPAIIMSATARRGLISDIFPSLNEP
jgi:hypothetical protein